MNQRDYFEIENAHDFPGNEGEQRQHKLRFVSPCQYLRYYLFTRRDHFNILHRGGRLFQQFLDDAWALIDTEKLNWARHNQHAFRADLYNGVADFLHDGDGDINKLGVRCMAPSNHPGTDRYMQRIYQNAMAVCRKYGRPSLFLTFTANPKWKEISVHLFPGQRVEDRPDLVSRMFHAKLRHFRDLIEKKHCFGRHVAHCFTIEYQKRGLPHCHYLLYLDRHDWIRTSEVVDRIILGGRSGSVPELALYTCI